MKDEIKQILCFLKQVIDNPEETFCANATTCYLLLDYITNLQEENKKLKEIVENLTTLTVCGDRKQIKNTAQYKLDIERLEDISEQIKNDIEGIIKETLESMVKIAKDEENI